MTDTSMGATQVAKAEFRVGSIFERSIEILLRHFVVYVVLMGIAALPYIFIEFQMGGMDPKELVEHLSSFTIPLLLVVILSIVGQAFVLDAAFQDMRGHPVEIGESLQRATTRLPAIIVMSLCLVIASLIGYLLLIVPGIIIQVMFFVAVPVCLVEKLGPIASLGRSRALTKGYRWKIFGIFFLLALGGGIAMAALGAIAGLGGFPVRVIVDFAARTVFGAFFAIVIAVIYHDLRVVKEGADPAQGG